MLSSHWNGSKNKSRLLSNPLNAAEHYKRKHAVPTNPLFFLRAVPRLLGGDGWHKKQIKKIEKPRQIIPVQDMWQLPVHGVLPDLGRLQREVNSRWESMCWQRPEVCSWFLPQAEEESKAGEHLRFLLPLKSMCSLPEPRAQLLQRQGRIIKSESPSGGFFVMPLSKYDT